jgi:hypothetical protein
LYGAGRIRLGGGGHRVGSDSIRSILIGSLILLVQIMIAGQSAADWKVYVEPGLGISAASVDTDGQASVAPTTFLFGSDDDSSPVISFATGLEVPMDELVPREWLLDIRLPDWPVRAEIEGSFLREYELRTKTSAADEFFTEIRVDATVFVNFWLDIPLLAVYKPVQYTFGLGRQPALRRWLEPASFYVGAGVGVSVFEIDGTANTIFGDRDVVEFAWNAGFGLSYALTESVAMSAGYRYVGLGKQDVGLDGPFTPTAADELEFDPDLHEFRVAVRVRVFEFFSPWR